MLNVKHHGPVTELRLAPTLLGRPLYQVSAFFFDGALLDTGPPRTGRELAAWAVDKPLDRIINTHHHEDHIGGNPFLDVPAYAPAGTVPILARAPRLPFYRWTIFGRLRPGRATPYYETVCTRHHTLHAIPTPGHAPEHRALWLPEKGWLFGGDLFIQERAKYIRITDNLALWLDSLRRVLAYDFDILYCCHAGLVPDAKNAIRRKIAYWEDVREKAVALSGRGLTPIQIRNELLGAESYLTRWSRGRFAKLNLVNALLALPNL